MSARRLASMLATLTTLALLAGCGGRGTLFDASLKPLPLVSTAGAAIAVVPGSRRAVLMTPDDPTTQALPLRAGARWAARVPGTELVAVLTGTAKAPTLDVLDVTARTVTRLDVPGFFDVITFSPDGRFGVLSYLAVGGTGALVARNLNEVGLWTVGAESVTRVQLDTESLAPRQVLFGPAEANRQLVAVTLDRGVAVFDALHPEVAPRRISIRPQGSASESSVAQALFSRDGRWLFLRATSLDDVIVVELGSEVGRSLNASINFVSGGRGLADLAVAPVGREDAVVALYSASSEAFLLDARGIQDNGLRLSLTLPATRLVPLGGSKVLLWDERGNALQAWDLADGRSGAQVLPGIGQTALRVPGQDRVLLPMPSTNGVGGPALAVVTVVDDTNRLRLQLQTIQLSGAMSARALDPSGQRLFFTVVGVPTVVTLELATLRLAEVTLDAKVTSLAFLADADFLVAEHAAPLGDLTLLPAGTTERSGARRFSGFAFAADLDHAGDQP